MPTWVNESIIGQTSYVGGSKKTGIKFFISYTDLMNERTIFTAVIIILIVPLIEVYEEVFSYHVVHRRHTHQIRILSIHRFELHICFEFMWWWFDLSKQVCGHRLAPRVLQVLGPTEVLGIHVLRWTELLTILLTPPTRKYKRSIGVGPEIVIFRPAIKMETYACAHNFDNRYHRNNGLMAWIDAL